MVTEAQMAAVRAERGVACVAARLRDAAFVMFFFLGGVALFAAGIGDGPPWVFRATFLFGYATSAGIVTAVLSAEDYGT